MIDLYEKMAIPKSCYLGKRIYKKLFYEHGSLNATDKKAFSNDIQEIKWQYTLKPETINIPRYEDDGREYFEVAIIQVNLKEERRYKRIAQIIQRAIPYPVFIVFRYDTFAAFNVASKLINRADREKIRVEDLQDTAWLDLDNPLKYEMDFLNSLLVTNYSYNNFYEFYSDIVNRIIALNCAVYTEEFSLSGKSREALADRLALLRELEKAQQEKNELRNKLRKEKNMGTQVQLNTEIKKISDRIEMIRSQL